jgi:hypothetical protein
MTSDVDPSGEAPLAPLDFSLVLAGPLFQVCHSTDLVDDAEGLVRRRGPRRIVSPRRSGR